MTARELIKELESLTEDKKDLPIYAFNIGSNNVPEDERYIIDLVDSSSNKRVDIDIWQ